MITDLEARKIASEWHGGQASALYAFASTGAINAARPDHDIYTEVRACIEGCKPTIRDTEQPIDERRATFREFNKLQQLEVYLDRAGTRGPQPGWSDLRW